MLTNLKCLSTCVLFSGLLIYTTSSSTYGQDFDDDEPQEFFPGLVAEYRWERHTTRQIDADLLFDWSDIPPLTRMQPGSDFSVRWTGQLQAKENGQFQLSMFACGRVKVTLAGKEILATESNGPKWLQSPPVDLRFGQHDLQVEFEKTSDGPRMSLFWSGPTFSLEPISSRYYFHRNDSTITSSIDERYELGQTLSRGLRCTACHDFGLSGKPLAAPALTHLQDNLRPSWLIERLTQTADQHADGTTSQLSQSRMPHFGLHPNDAAAIAAALFDASAKSSEPESLALKLRAANQSRAKKEPEIRFDADAHQGEIAFVSIGCLACHQVGELGQSVKLAEQVFGGGELTSLAKKRTGNFVKRWLEDPAQVNADHRMPIFELSHLERLDLAEYLSTLGAQASANDTQAAGDISRGVALIAEHRCGACHQLPAALNAPHSQRSLAKSPITADSQWDAGCLVAPDAAGKIPGFGLIKENRNALRQYLTTVNPQAEQLARGAHLIIESNCIACHSRDLSEGLKARLPEIVAAVPDVAPRLAAIAPPTLTAVGDKYHADALKSAIARQSAPLRPWLDVRMPKFKLSDGELDQVAQQLIAHDRIPDAAGEASDLRINELAIDSLTSDAATRLAAGRLVTAEGFGCQSCHQIGEGDVPKVDLNARGTNLAMLGERVRPDWFSRWVRNPARMVPRMEMPAIQTAVKGVLHDSLDMQLAALWTTLNTPDFRPPRPGPVRVVRTHNLPDVPERAWLLTDVIETPHKSYIRPMVIGLPNRQNFLFDLESGNLSTWWLGDIAHQHTRGKSWYWEPGASLLNDDAIEGAVVGDDTLANGPQALEQISLVDKAGQHWWLSPLGQFSARLDRVEHIESGIVWHGRLHLVARPKASGGADAHGVAASSRWLSIKQTFRAASGGTQATSVCETELNDLQPGDKVQLTSIANLAGAPVSRANGAWQAVLQGRNTLIAIESSAAITQSGSHAIEFSLAKQDMAKLPQGPSLRWSSTYSSLIPTDEFPLVEIPDLVVKPIAIDIVPGYAGVQLPLPSSEMPISFAWDKTGRFFIGSLKGRVLEVLDRDSDGLAETYELISDEFPTPFGLFAHEKGIDALAKFALIRLTPSSVKDAPYGTPYDATVVADGWGYTADYHDWAIGLERDADHNYYMALPCQQDDRSEESAYLRGNALKLIPYNSTEEPRQYRIEPLAAGLRFPIGIALSATGDLFTSDNQGNYNPFNELNHLRPGKRYGFINKLENKDGFSPPFESPAVNLPHPWTRSVNGMCFLSTPLELRSDQPHFGPFEGHLIGCEMNGKSLVRMSLQKVGETYQGAAYMFSRPVQTDEANLEGPIVCEVSPAGDLIVGSLQDSGWSGGQNTGSIVRLRPTGELPLGIAEMRATATGFEIDFTQPVDREKAVRSSSYQLRSYQRISTPAYGGDDQDDRTEQLQSVQVSADGRRVILQLANLREGFVYELNLSPLGSDDAELFPSQAHYTLRAIPDA